MRIINVIEVVDNNVQNIESFGIIEEQLSDDVVEQAEKLFTAKVRANEGSMIRDEELAGIIEDGYWNATNYAVNLVWSDIDD